MAKPENKTKQRKLETNQRYLEQLDEIKVRFPKGYKQAIKDYAAGQNISVNQLILRAIRADALANGVTLDIPAGMRYLPPKEGEEVIYMIEEPEAMQIEDKRKNKG